MEELRQKVLEAELSKTICENDSTDALQSSWQASMGLAYVEALEKAAPVLAEAEGLRVKGKEIHLQKLEAVVARTSLVMCFCFFLPSDFLSPMHCIQTV